MLIPAEVVQKIGYLNEEYFLYAEDTDYCCRILQAGLKIQYCRDSVIYHKISRSTGEMSSNTQYYMMRNNLMIIRKYGIHKAYAYYKMLYMSIRDVIKHRKLFRPTAEAAYDFLKNRKGKR